MMKRAGRGHDRTGVNGTRRGELVVECPACPKPNVNLPDGWDKVRDELKYVIKPTYWPLTAESTHRYLYFMFVSLDACFRVKRFDISDEKKDPIIDDGLAYFVADGPYKEQVKKYKNQAPVSTLHNVNVMTAHLA